MEQFGLDWDHLHAINPRLIMVRMPAFGLDGPWRDRTGFAQTMECLTGMAWLTGLSDGPPVLVRGACDPLAGMHAVFATLLALIERDRSGRGRLVEVPMVEAALNAAAEQVIEFGSTGTLLGRDGNRGPGAAPQGVYPCSGHDEWVAIAVATDTQWRSLCSVLGDPQWSVDRALRDGAGRRRAHDLIDGELTAWTARLNAMDVSVAAAVGRSSLRAGDSSLGNCVEPPTSSAVAVRDRAPRCHRRPRTTSTTVPFWSCRPLASLCGTDAGGAQ